MCFSEKCKNFTHDSTLLQNPNLGDLDTGNGPVPGEILTLVIIVLQWEEKSKYMNALWIRHIAQNWLGESLG